MTLPNHVVRGWPADLRDSYYSERHREKVEAEALRIGADTFPPRMRTFLVTLIDQRLSGEKPNISAAAAAAGVRPSTPRAWRMRVPGFLAAEIRAQEGTREPKPKPQATSYLGIYGGLTASERWMPEVRDLPLSERVDALQLLFRLKIAPRLLAPGETLVDRSSEPSPT